MPRITIETKKRIGHIQRVYEETFDLPDTIFYENQILHYDNYHQAYYSRTSGLSITAKDYVAKELQQNLINNIDDEMEQ